MNIRNIAIIRFGAISFGFLLIGWFFGNMTKARSEVHFLDKEKVAGLKGGDSFSPVMDGDLQHSAGNGGAAEPRELRQMAMDPYFVISDSEISALALKLDLKDSKVVHALNGIASPLLRDRMWKACVSSNLGRNSLEELASIASKAVTSDGVAHREPLVQWAVERSDYSILSQGWADQVLRELLVKQMAESNKGDLKSLLERIDSLGLGASRKAQAIMSWADVQENVDGVSKALELFKDGKIQTEGLGKGFYTLWDKVKEDDVQRSKLLDSIGKLNEMQKNRTLEMIGLNDSNLSCSAVVSIIGSATSGDVQAAIAEKWINRNPKEKLELLQLLKAQGLSGIDLENDKPKRSD